MASLETKERTVLELRLQEYSTEEIAEKVHRSPRTIRRILERLQARLEERLG